MMEIEKRGHSLLLMLQCYDILFVANLLDFLCYICALFYQRIIAYFLLNAKSHAVLKQRRWDPTECAGNGIEVLGEVKDISLVNQILYNLGFVLS
mmetsp:Transcript_9208/g.14754  ORF Transcript_9208/g.14754 Transcript_9208/m.14754 type:complete len:95 (-) Transcript_9208:256-540(-)